MRTLCCHFTPNTIPDRCSLQLCLPPPGLRNSLPRPDSIDYRFTAATNKSCWTRTHLTSSSSIFPLLILLAGWVTSWRSCWPCVRKFTARCYHPLCGKRIMFRLLHLLERAALYCKCAISIHEGIYMHSQAALLVFISHVAHSKSYGVLPSYDGSP